MKKLTVLFGITVLMTSCNLFENKEKKAIEICQKAKVQLQTDNVYANLFINAVGLSENSTWLDYANIIAKEDPNKKYDWNAKKTDENNLYLVRFNDSTGWGYSWEVDIEQQIVKNINQNEYLSRKYGYSPFDPSENFEITNIKTDTLKLVKSNSYNSESGSKEVIYVLKASVKNKTGKIITDAKISGKLQVIFKDKTIEGNSDDFLYGEGGFKTDVTKSRPWNPDAEKDFFIKTKGIEDVYLSYEPEYVFFDVNLEAEDPIGFTYDKCIVEYDLKDEWKTLK